jgi:hypothetical protein
MSASGFGLGISERGGRREEKTKTNHDLHRGSFPSRTGPPSHFLGTLITPYPWSRLVLLSSGPNPVLHWLSSSRVRSLASYPTLPALVNFLPLPAELASFVVDRLRAFLSLSAGLALVVVDIRVARWRISPHHLHGGGAKSWVTPAHIPWWRGGAKMVVVATMTEVANDDGDRW